MAYVAEDIGGPKEFRKDPHSSGLEIDGACWDLKALATNLYLK